MPLLKLKLVELGYRTGKADQRQGSGHPRASAIRHTVRPSSRSDEIHGGERRTYTQMRTQLRQHPARLGRAGCVSVPSSAVRCAAAAPGEA